LQATPLGFFSALPWGTIHGALPNRPRLLPNKDGVLNIGSLEAKIIPRTDEEDNIKEKLGPLGFKPLTFFESRDTKETAQRACFVALRERTPTGGGGLRIKAIPPT